MVGLFTFYKPAHSYLIHWRIVMNKELFIKHLADRTKTDPAHLETAVDATLAEIVSAKIFGPDIGKVGFLDNNCNNNCKAEQAAIPGIAVR